MRVSIAIFGLVMFVAYPVEAATVKGAVSKEGKTTISLEGDIVPDDVEAVTSIIKASNESGRVVSGIRLNSQGGSLGAGLSLAKVVRYAKIATVVANGSTCASACFLVFAAGSEKFASHSGRIGVHGASERSGEETIRAGAATVSMAREARELGVSEAIIGKMVITPPAQMVWLSPNDLRSIGTTMTGKPSQTIEDGVIAAQVPAQTNTGPQTPTKKEITWESVVAKIIALSSDQNKGRPKSFRSCQPEMRICTNAIVAVGNDGKEVLLKKTEDMEGRTIKREFCSFNEHGDVRVCMNWDTGEKHRDMQNAKGEWYKVADE